MSNETGYYFGAYLEIKVNQVEEVESFYGCKNGHRQQERFGEFCSKCGAPTAPQTNKVTEYPWHIYDILGKDWENELSVITPHSMFRTGTILAKGNYTNRPDGEWLYLDRFGNDIDTKQFPTDKEITQMKTDLQTGYADIIEALKQSEVVVSVEIKAGYVLDEEY